MNSLAARQERIEMVKGLVQSMNSNDDANK